MTDAMAAYLRLLAVGAGTVGGAAAGAALYDEHPAIGAGVGNAAMATGGLAVDGAITTAIIESKGDKTSNTFLWAAGAAPITLSTIGAVVGAVLWKKHPVVGASLGSAAGIAAGVGVDFVWMTSGGFGRN